MTNNERFAVENHHYSIDMIDYKLNTNNDCDRATREYSADYQIEWQSDRNGCIRFPLADETRVQSAMCEFPSNISYLFFMIYLNPYGKVTDCVSLKGNLTNAEKKTTD